MSYMHIDNLYKDFRILSFRWCYAMEKIHGTSAHVGWRDEKLFFFAGGCKHEQFIALFDHEKLAKKFQELKYPKITIYGEAYGGKMQSMKETYGDKLKFIAFEVKNAYEHFYCVPKAAAIAAQLDLEFVYYQRTSTDIAVLDSLRDTPSVLAQRNGCGIHPREGIVLRPPFEVTLNNGKRLIAKHKSDLFKERKHPPKVGTTLEVLQEAEKIANEWVTRERLYHVADAIAKEIQVENIGDLIRGMQDDIAREAKGEMAETPAVWKFVGKKTALITKEICRERLAEYGR